MPEIINLSDERRRSPRFSCDGEARIYRLPWDGGLVYGRLRNLSLGGICVDTTHPIDPGARTEMLVCVNSAASFRTIGLVRAMMERSRACVEFVQMSAGSKLLLGDLVDQLARLQTAMMKLRSEQVDTEEELSRELEDAGACAALFGPQGSTIRRLPDEKRSEGESGSPDAEKRIVELTPLVIKVDLFG